MHIRSSVNGLIIEEGKLLVIKKTDGDQWCYILPGGGQEFGETLEEALIREVREEVGASIEHIQFLCVREYIGKNHEFALRDQEVHVVTHIFNCKIDQPDVYTLQPDDDQIAVCWIALDELETYQFYPKEMIPMIKNLTTIPTYVGDIN